MTHSAEFYRNDISTSLIHLTRGTDDETPLDILKKILSDGKIKGSNNTGFIKGKNSATCFTEMPISATKYFATGPEEDLPKQGLKFSYYGIAISKKSGFHSGARPVIHLPNDEAEWIPEDERWRHVRLEEEVVDWTHEREWRLLGDYLLKKSRGIYILHWTPTEYEEIKGALHPDIKKKIRGYLPMKHLRDWL